MHCNAAYLLKDGRGCAWTKAAPCKKGSFKVKMKFRLYSSQVEIEKSGYLTSVQDAAGASIVPKYEVTNMNGTSQDVTSTISSDWYSGGTASGTGKLSGSSVLRKIDHEYSGTLGRSSATADWNVYIDTDASNNSIWPSQSDYQ